jgi:hypothetical protein
MLAQTAVLHLNGETTLFEGHTVKRLDEICKQKERSIPRLSQWASLWSRNFGIASCLSMSLNSTASDPRDMVFAITGLLQPHIRAMISIDYMSPIEQVFQQAVVACLHAYGYLGILRYANLPADAHTLTSNAFGIEHFKRYLEEISRQNIIGVFGIHLLKVPVPWHQILPRLKLRVHWVGVCRAPINQGIDELLSLLLGDRKTFDDSQWSWLIHQDYDAFYASYYSNHPLSDDEQRRLLYDPKVELHSIRRELQRVINGTGLHDPTIFKVGGYVGFTTNYCRSGDVVGILNEKPQSSLHDIADIGYSIVEGPYSFLLCEDGKGGHRIIGQCHVWEIPRPAFTKPYQPWKLYERDVGAAYGSEEIEIY